MITMNNDEIQLAGNENINNHTLAFIDFCGIWCEFEPGYSMCVANKLKAEDGHISYRYVPNSTDFGAEIFQKIEIYESSKIIYSIC